jgi:hypothetical protein
MKVQPVTVVPKPLPAPPLDSVANDKRFSAGVGEIKIGSVAENLPVPVSSRLDMDEEPISTIEVDPADARRKERESSDEEE